MKYILGKYPGATAAYSLRRISSITAGSSFTNIIEITRDSDATSKNISYTATGDLDTDAINGFCVGTTCKVTKWYNQSKVAGQDLNVLVGTAPIIYENGAIVTGTNGKPAIKFSGNGHLQTAAAESPLSEFTVFTIAEFADNSTSGQVLFTFREANIFRSTNSQAIKSNFSNGDIESFANTKYIPIKNFNESAVICVVGSNVPVAGYISFGGGDLQQVLDRTPKTTSSKLILGSGTEAGTNRFSGKVQEILYYQSNRIGDKFEIESDLNSVYNSSYINRSQLDTIENSFVSSKFNYSLRISKPILQPVIEHGRTAEQLAAVGVLPLLDITKSTGATVLVYPDVNGTISLNSVVRLKSGTSFTFTKPIPTLGEFLGNPKYAPAQITHVDGFVTKWYNQAYDESLTARLDDVTHLLQGTLINSPKIYDATAGDFTKLNGKPAIYFEANKTLKTANITAFPLVARSITNTTQGFLNFLVYSTNAILANAQTIVTFSRTSGTSQDILKLEIDSTSTSKFIGTIITSASTITSDTSSNTLSPNTQYLASSARFNSRFYVTANGLSDTKQNNTAAIRDLTSLTSPGSIQFGGSNFQGYIQEFVHFDTPGESYKIDIEEEINRYYKIQSLEVLSTSLATKYPAGLKALYSLRKTGNANATYLLRIRRAADNLERFIYPDFEGKISYSSIASPSINTSSTETLGQFCEGTNCFIVAWADQSGSGNNLGQSTAANQPQITTATSGLIIRNRLPSVRFDGTNHHLSGSINISSIPVSIAGVYRISSSSGTKHILGLSGASDNLHFYINGSTPSIRRNTDTAVTTSGSSINSQDTACVSFSTTTTGNTAGGIVIMGNNATLRSQTGVTNTINAAITSINVGRKDGSATSEFFSGEIQEIMIWENSTQSLFAVGEPTLQMLSDYYKVF